MAGMRQLFSGSARPALLAGLLAVIALTVPLSPSAFAGVACVRGGGGCVVNSQTCPDGSTVLASQTCPAAAAAAITTVSCPGGAVVPSGSACPAPATITCPGGAVVASAQSCIPVRTACPDGSVAFAPQVCTTTTTTCPDGTVIYTTQTCPAPTTVTCPDGTVVFVNNACPTVPTVACGNGTFIFPGQICPVQATVFCSNGTFVSPGQACPIPQFSTSEACSGAVAYVTLSMNCLLVTQSSMNPGDSLTVQTSGPAGSYVSACGPATGGLSCSSTAAGASISCFSLCPAGSTVLITLASPSFGPVSETGYYVPAGGVAQTLTISPNPPAGF